jgi:anti-anti-sigma factor
MALKVSVNRKEPGVFHLTIFGPIDSTTYTMFEREVAPFLNKSTKAIILNMEGVDYVSSLGIGAIFKVMKTMQEFEANLLVTNLQPQIKKVFDTVKAMPESIFRSIEEVDAYLDEIQKRMKDNK